MSRYPPEGRKGASELQELGANKRPGHVQGKVPLGCPKIKSRAGQIEGRTLTHPGKSRAWMPG